MIDRSPGEVLESRGGAEVIFANSDDGRVGIEARDDWILDRSHDGVESMCWRRMLTTIDQAYLLISYFLLEVEQVLDRRF